MFLGLLAAEACCVWEVKGGCLEAVLGIGQRPFRQRRTVVSRQRGWLWGRAAPGPAAAETSGTLPAALLGKRCRGALLQAGCPGCRGAAEEPGSRR